MEKQHDFEADNRFFIENYGTLMDLYSGKHIIIARDRVLYVAETDNEATEWAYKFCIAGKCSIFHATPQTYMMHTEGIVI